MIQFRILTLSGLILSACLLSAPHVTSAEPSEGPSLPNTRWVGSETLPGFGRLEFRFGESGDVVMIDTAGRTKGEYGYGNGRNLILIGFGDCVYTGTLNGQTLSGTARADGKTWTFSVRLTRN